MAVLSVSIHTRAYQYSLICNRDRYTVRNLKKELFEPFSKSSNKHPIKYQDFGDGAK